MPVPAIMAAMCTPLSYLTNATAKMISAIIKSFSLSLLKANAANKNNTTVNPCMYSWKSVDEMVGTSGKVHSCAFMYTVIDDAESIRKETKKNTQTVFCETVAIIITLLSVH